VHLLALLLDGPYGGGKKCQCMSKIMNVEPRINYAALRTKKALHDYTAHNLNVSATGPSGTKCTARSLTTMLQPNTQQSSIRNDGARSAGLKKRTLRCISIPCTHQAEKSLYFLFGSNIDRFSGSVLCVMKHTFLMEPKKQKANRWLFKSALPARYKSSC